MSFSTYMLTKICKAKWQIYSLVVYFLSVVKNTYKFTFSEEKR